MNRRRFSILALFTPVIVITGCDSEPTPSPTACFFNNDDIAKAMKRLENGINELQSQVGSFSDDDWKDVVPEVQNASSSVWELFEEVKKSLGYENF